MTKHTIRISWSPEDNAFLAEVPDLPGCIADGATRAEALTNAETVIQEWIQTARALGRTIPEPNVRQQFT